MFILDARLSTAAASLLFFVLLSISCLLPSALIVSRMGLGVCVVRQ